MHLTSRPLRWPLCCLLTLLLFSQISSPCPAQSSLFATPTSDVLGEGEFYIEADFDAHFARYRNGGWQSYGFQTIYGAGKRTEVGLNAYAARTAGGLAPVELQPNIKYQLYNDESNGISAAAGAIAYIPLSRKARSESVANVYATVSKKSKASWSPRFSAGAYQMIGARSDSGSRNGFMLGVEQPVHKRVTLIADWNTGKNRLGYAAAGVGVTLTRNSYLCSAYYFGNEGAGNNSLGVYYGFSF